MTPFKLLGRIEAVIAGTFLVLMVLLIFAGGIARMLGHPLNWTVDAATALFAWSCFLCADLAWRNNALMSIDLIPDRLSPGARRILTLVNLALIAAFLVYVAVMGGYLAWSSRFRNFQGIPWLSYSWVTLSLVVGAALMLLTTAVKIRAVLRGEHETSHARDVI